MRIYAGILCLFMLLPLRGLELVDGTVDGCAPIHRQAMLLAVRNGWKISIKRAEAPQALEQFRGGKTDILIVESTAIPADLNCIKRRFAFLAAAIYINSNNTCTGLTINEIRNILSSDRPTWRSITGNLEDIHLFGLKQNASGYGFFDRVALPENFEIKSPVFRTGSTGNVIQLCAANPVSFGIGLLSEAPNSMVRPLAIDGIEPTYNNLQTGKYPLMVTYVVLCREESSAEVKTLLAALGSKEFRELCKEEFLIVSNEN